MTQTKISWLNPLTHAKYVAQMRGWSWMASLLLVGSCAFKTPPDVEWDADPRDSEPVDAPNAAPTVVSNFPVDTATDAEPDGVVQATFSEDMDAATINAATFLVTRNGAPLTGQVSYESSSRVATFTPDSASALLGRHTVTITTAVADAEGVTMASTHSWGFAVRDGTWGTPELIDTTEAGSSNFGRQLAVNPDGSAVVVWDRTDGTRENVWANRFVPADGWGTAEHLENVTNNVYGPDVGVDAAGNAIAVWSQVTGTNASVWGATYASGWGTSAVVDSANIGSSLFSLRVAVAPDGTAIGVWHHFTGTRYDVWANRFVPGTGWGTPEFIETDDGSLGGHVVAIDAAGNAVAVWNQNDGTRTNIWANRFLVASGWGTAQLIETTDLGHANEPKIAMNALGDALAVWTQSDGTRTSIWANHFAAGGGWSGATLIETDDTGDARLPSVAIDPAGNAIAVWQQADSLRTNIWANTFDIGTGWGTPVLIETNNLGGAMGAEVAVDAGGNAIASWSQLEGARYNCWVNRFVAGTGWGTAQPIDASDFDAYAADVGIDAGGQVVAVWHQSDGTDLSVWSSTLR